MRPAHPVALVMLAAFAANVVYVLAIKQYFVQPDELEYVKQALHIGEQWHPILSGDRDFTSWSQLQPVLMAPVFSLLSANSAFVVQHILNAAMMTSAAIPAYLLTMRVTRHRQGAVLVALLTVAVPWVAMSATVLTEVAAYPAFVWALLAVHNAVTRPGWRNDLVGLAGVALALAARPQLAVLGPVLVLAALAQELRMPRRRTGVGRHPVHRRARDLATAHPILFPGALLVLVAIGATGVLRSTGGALGTYSVTTGGTLLPAGFWAMGREALAYVAFGVGILPLSLTLAFVLSSLWRPMDPERHAFAVIALLTGAGLVLSVGSFSVRFTGGINSRYVFYLAPVLFIGTVALLTQRPRARGMLLAGGLVATWLIHDAKLTLRGPSLVSPDSAFHDVLFGRTYVLEKTLALRDIPAPRLLAVAGLAAVVALLVAGHRGRGRGAAVTVMAAITLWCVVETAYTFKKVADTQRGVSADFLDGRSWIDDALPRGATAPMLISSFGDPASSAAVWWDTAFWNKKVRHTLQFADGDTLTQAFPELLVVPPMGRPAPDYLPLVPRVGSSGWLVRSAVDRRFGLAGGRVAAERDGVQLLQIAPGTRLAWYLYDASDTGLLARGAQARLAIFGRPGVRRVSITIGVAPGATRRGLVRLHAPGLTRSGPIAVRRPATFRLTVRVTAAPAQIRIVSAGRPAMPVTTAGAAAVPDGLQIQRVQTR